MEEYTLNCLVPGAKDTFSVKIKNDQSVDDLKKVIKKKNEPRFNHFDADELTLYRVEDDKSYDGQKRIDELEWSSQNLNECTKLNDEEQQLSEFFGESAPEGKQYYILVVPPQSKSIDPRACGAVRC